MPENQMHQPTTIDVPSGPGSTDQAIDGPHVVIDGVALEANRTTLSPAEVARVMRLPESEVRNMLRRGDLQDVSCDGRRRLDPDEVIAAVERRVQTGELEKHVFVELAALIAGRL
ncbi:MAG TPA: helix-turn-helix domain-containing protein [Solirubrobacteraceae bacterium]